MSFAVHRFKSYKDRYSKSTTNRKKSVYRSAIIYRKSNVAPSSRYVPPPRITPPNTIQDFDLENWNDPSQCSEYAQDIFQYYKNREVYIYINLQLV